MKDYKLSDIKAMCDMQKGSMTSYLRCKTCPIKDTCFELTKVPTYWQIDKEEQDDE